MYNYYRHIIIFTVNRTLDVGVYNVQWRVEDPCGNSDVCNKRLEVRDAALPIIRCRDITLQIPESGIVQVNAAQFDNNSTDNCTENLAFTFNGVNGPSVLTFSCGNLDDNQATSIPLVLVAQDDAGNSTSSTNVNIPA